MNRTPWTHSFHIAKVAALETVLINRSFKIVNNPDSINFRISKLVISNSSLHIRVADSARYLGVWVGFGV